MTTRKLLTAVLLFAGIAVSMPPYHKLDKPLITADYRSALKQGLNRALRPIRGLGEATAVTGTRYFPVACIKYPNFAETYTTGAFQQRLFNVIEWPNPSARHYFQTVSFGQFDIDGTVVGWVTANNNRAYYGYGSGIQRAALLAKEAAQKVDSLLNFAAFDADSDGFVDIFTVIHAGYGLEETGDYDDIWSHLWSLSEAGVGVYTTNDPRPGHPGQYIKIDGYVMCPERSNITQTGTMVSIGVFCHEWGHALGLPDLYDTDGGGSGIGNWSLMATGSWGGNNASPWRPTCPDAWCYERLGWRTPIVVPNVATLCTIPAATYSNGRIYKLVTAADTSEYWLITNRCYLGYDLMLPGVQGGGLLIQHIDNAVIRARESLNMINAGGIMPYGVCVEEADGAIDLQDGTNRGDGDDVWPGFGNWTVFSDSSSTSRARLNSPANGLSGCKAWMIPPKSYYAVCSLKSGGSAPPPSGDVGVAAITAPATTIDSGSVQTPAAWVKNYGTTAIGSFSVRFWVGSYYTDTRTVAGLGVGESTLVTFANWTVAVPRGSYTAKCSTLVAGDANTANDCKTRSLTVRVTDAAVVAITAPIGAVDSGAVITPRATVQNCGSVSATIPVTLKIGTAYTNTQSVALAAGAQTSVTFANWTASPRGTLTVRCSTGLAGDLVRANDTVSSTVVVGGSDAAVVAISAPSGTVDSGTVITPQATVVNNGTAAVTFPVTLRIGSLYVNTQTVSLAAGAQTSVAFAAWTALPRGNLTVRCSTGLANDANSANDTMSSVVTVRVVDAAAVTITAPTGTVDSGAVITPQALVANYGTAAVTVPVRLRIGTAYSNTRNVTVQPGMQVSVSFNNWTALPRGNLVVRCSTYLSGDQQRSNDTISGNVFVRVTDAAALTIAAPTGTVDSGAVITPQATVANRGNQSLSIPVTMRIGSLYSNTQSITVPAGGQSVVTFSPWTAQQRGNLAVRCSTALAGDQVASNNLVTGSVTVNVTDAGVVSVLAPTGAVDSGTVVTPRAMVANYGMAAATFAVTMRIGSSYTNTRTVTVPAGAQNEVTFGNWMAMQRGVQDVRCWTVLSGDLNRSNDTLVSSTRVRVWNAGVLSIDAPSGVYDSGTLVIPHAVVVNRGTEPAVVPVALSVSSGYCDTQYVVLQPGEEAEATFAPWDNMVRGEHTVRCSTGLAFDMVRADDTLTTAAVVRVLDVGVSGLGRPHGTIDSGAQVVPAVSIYNPGTEEAVFALVLSIGSDYRDEYTIELAAGDQAEVLFRPWAATGRGRQTVRCSLDFEGDAVPANDTASTSVTVAVHDAAVVELMAPSDSVPPGVVVPMLRLRNCGTVREPVRVLLDIAGPTRYTDSLVLDSGLPVEADTVLQFAPWNAGRGRYTARGMVVLATEQCPENNSLERQFVVGLGNLAPGWHPAESLPGTTYVRDGGALTFEPISGKFYALKGSRTLEYWSYRPGDSGWTQEPSVPGGDRDRGVYRGSAICCGAGCVYLAKGNNTTEFYRFDVATQTWGALTSIPEGPNRKKVRSGAGMVYVAKPNSDHVYLLKGGDNAFWRYDVGTDTFVELAPAPVGDRPRYGRGSWLVYDGCRYIYALKARYNELHRYDVSEERWDTAVVLSRMPLVSGVTGRRNKKAGDGGCAAFDGNVIYALKGNSTQEFWQYLPADDTWIELESIPKAYPGSSARKRVKAGAALAYYPETGVCYALKGNRSRQFWTYVPGGISWQNAISHSQSGVMASDRTIDARVRLAAVPNPLSTGTLVIRFSPTTSNRWLSVRDVAGRCLVSQSVRAGRDWCQLDLHGLAAGVYILSLEGGGSSEKTKLVVEQ